MGLFSKLTEKVLGKTVATSPVSGESTVQLPAGTVKVSYDEKRMGRSTEDDWSGCPGGLQITIRPAGGGDPLPIEQPRMNHEYAGGGRIGSRIGDVQIPVAGEYVVTVTGVDAGDDMFEPCIAFKT